MYQLKNVTLLLLVVISVVTGLKNENPQVFLSLYYESKCPESRDFILHHLLPTISLLHHYIVLRLIPFGKSKSVDFGLGGFICHRGPSECLGNMIQDCTLNHMYQQSDLERVKYVACEMKTKSGTRGSLDCVRKTKVSPERVERCLKTSQGIQYQLSSEYLTNVIRPVSLPTIVIDGIFDSDIQKFSHTNLLGVVCSVIKETKPCAEYFNKIALNHILRYPLNFTEMSMIKNQI